MEEKENLNQEKEIVQQTEEQQVDWYEMYLRSVADFTNMRNRYEKMLSDYSRFGIRETIEKVVSPLFNDIARGMKNGVDGCDLMYKNLYNNLRSMGIEPIGWNIKYGVFNEETMEAIGICPTDKSEYDNTVSEVYEYGFFDTIDKKVITHAKVVIYKKMIDKDKQEK